MPETLNNGSSSEYYPPYAEFSKTLRTWFVAYGIGAPVVLLSNAAVWTRISDAHFSFQIGVLFLTGGGLQVVLAYLNKHAMWKLYYGEPSTRESDDEYIHRMNHTNTELYKLSSWYARQNWIDQVLDFASLIAFGWATYLALRVVSMPPEMIYLCDREASEMAWRVAFVALTLVVVLGIAISRQSDD